MSEPMHCCNCGRDWMPDAHWPHHNTCPACDSREVRTLDECLECQGRAVVPREKWLCRPYEQDGETKP